MEENYNATKDKLLEAANYLIKAETVKLTRENNRRISTEQFKLMHDFSKKHEEYKDMLFIELKDKLEKFMSTRDYITLLLKQIKEGRKIAGTQTMIVYVDPADEPNVYNLEISSRENIKVYEKSFGGGTLIKIPSRNILIDNTFDTKIAKIRANFTFKTEAL